jgi:hypothetical protein
MAAGFTSVQLSKSTFGVSVEKELHGVGARATDECLLQMCESHSSHL